MKMKTFSKFFRKAFVLLIVLQMLLMSVFAEDDILSLYKNKESDNTPFAVADMLPGDYIKQDYRVRVSYNGTITVHFGITVRDSYAKLAEVLECRVVLPDEQTLLYEGFMRDLVDVSHEITGVNTTEDLHYEIAVFLDTSVGNEYEDLQLIADFEWWVETEEDPVDPPGGGGGGGGGGDKPPVDPDDPDKPPVDPDDPDDPDKPPVDPEDPDKPIDPDDPDNPPVNPDDPDRPIDPNDPNAPSVDPDDPDSPDAPDKPTDPDKPAVNPDGTPKGELIDPPYTGDNINPILLIAIICISLFIILLILFIRKRNKKETNKTMRQLTICIAIIIVLAIALCVTTFALIRSSVMVENNTFDTGKVKINLNNGNKIIDEGEFLFEPGMTVAKEFFIKNESTDSVYYKLYLDNVRGGLASVLEVQIIDDKTGDILFLGNPKEFTQDNFEPRELFLNEERTFTAVFHYPEESGNSTKNLYIEFDMHARATQMRHNYNKEF